MRPQAYSAWNGLVSKTWVRSSRSAPSDTKTSGESSQRSIRRAYRSASRAFVSPVTMASSSRRISTSPGRPRAYPEALVAGSKTENQMASPASTSG